MLCDKKKLEQKTKELTCIARYHLPNRWTQGLNCHYSNYSNNSKYSFFKYLTRRQNRKNLRLCSKIHCWSFYLICYTPQRETIVPKVNHRNWISKTQIEWFWVTERLKRIHLLPKNWYQKAFLLLVLKIETQQCTIILGITIGNQPKGQRDRRRNPPKHRLGFILFMSLKLNVYLGYVYQQKK